MLIKISKETGTFIPVLPFLIEVIISCRSETLIFRRFSREKTLLNRDNEPYLLITSSKIESFGKMDSFCILASETQHEALFWLFCTFEGVITLWHLASWKVNGGDMSPTVAYLKMPVRFELLESSRISIESLELPSAMGHQNLE